MQTLHDPPDIDGDPPPATPYFLRWAEFDREVEAEKARRMGPGPLAA